MRFSLIAFLLMLFPLHLTGQIDTSSSKPSLYFHSDVSLGFSTANPKAHTPYPHFRFTPLPVIGLHFHLNYTSRPKPSFNLIFGLVYSKLKDVRYKTSGPYKYEAIIFTDYTRLYGGVEWHFGRFYWRVYENGNLIYDNTHTPIYDVKNNYFNAVIINNIWLGRHIFTELHYNVYSNWHFRFLFTFRGLLEFGITYQII